MDFHLALVAQISSHPLLRSEDFLKLAYQAAYGGEHLVASVEAAQAFFDGEYGEVKAAALPLYEDIGNGLVRVNFASWKKERLPPEALLGLFLKSASVSGSGDRLFPKYLEQITQLVSVSAAPLSLEEWKRAVASYEKSGGGPVHHSPTYAQAYDPHYRIVRKALLKRYLAALKARPAQKASPVLETPRLILRPFEAQDLDAVHAWCSSKKVTEWLLWRPHRSKEVTWRLLQDWIKKKRNYAWAIEEGGAVIGEIEVLKDRPDKGAEIGYLLSEKKWREGLMGEALAEALRFLFAEGKYRYVFAEADERNLPSLGLLRKLGFREVGKKRSYIGKKKSDVTLLGFRLNPENFRT
jgi:ribosomal-protein-alanine N-acetyltransferase